MYIQCGRCAGFAAYLGLKELKRRNLFLGRPLLTTGSMYVALWITKHIDLSYNSALVSVSSIEKNMSALKVF